MHTHAHTLVRVLVHTHTCMHLKITLAYEYTWEYSWSYINTFTLMKISAFDDQSRAALLITHTYWYQSYMLTSKLCIEIMCLYKNDVFVYINISKNMWISAADGKSRAALPYTYVCIWKSCAFIYIYVYIYIYIYTLYENGVFMHIQTLTFMWIPATVVNVVQNF